MNPEVFINRWKSAKGQELRAEFAQALLISDPEEAERTLVFLSSRHDSSTTIVRAPQMDMRGIHLEDVTIHELDLQQVDFGFSTLINCRFVNVHLMNVDFSYCQLSDCVFENCDIDTSNWRYAEVQNCSFNGSRIGALADPSFSKWSNCSFANKFIYFQVQNAVFTDCNFENIEFRAKGEMLSFNNCKFQETVFEEFPSSAKCIFNGSETPEFRKTET